MGDHYCCSTCHLRYDDCKCHRTTKELTMSQVTPTVDPIKLGLEDVKYFHDKFQKYKDEKSANQLVLAVQEFIKTKGQ